MFDSQQEHEFISAHSEQNVSNPGGTGDFLTAKKEAKSDADEWP
jgi:hypothetical protein